MIADVALTAIERGMFVRILVVQPLLIVVTGETDRLDLAKFTQIHFQRLMWIMTTDTVFQSKMTPAGFRVTTVAAFCHCYAVRFMFGVTCRTASQFLLMGGTLGIQSFSLVFMTRSTEALRDIRILMQLNVLRLVCRVTKHAVFLLHRLFVTVVAIKTDTSHRMLAVTAGTILLTVRARHRSKVLLNILVTADTNRSMWLVILQFQHQRLVR